MQSNGYIFKIYTQYKGPFGYSWKLKTEKYCSKIIFKYVNCTVGPIFNEKVTEKWNLWVHEQCTMCTDWLKKCKKSQTLRLLFMHSAWTVAASLPNRGLPYPIPRFPYPRSQTPRILCAKRTDKQCYPSEKKKLKQKYMQTLTLTKVDNKFEGVWRLSKLRVPIHSDSDKDYEARVRFRIRVRMRD